MAYRTDWLVLVACHTYLAFFWSSAVVYSHTYLEDISLVATSLAAFVSCCSCHDLLRPSCPATTPSRPSTHFSSYLSHFTLIVFHAPLRCRPLLSGS